MARIVPIAPRARTVFPEKETGLELRDGDDVLARLYHSTDLFLLEGSGAPEHLGVLIDTVAEAARFRGVKLNAVMPNLLSVLADPRYRDVRLLAERSHAAREVDVPVSPALQAFLREIALVARELDAHDVYKEDERRSRRRGTMHVWILTSGEVELTIDRGKGRKHEARVSADEVWQVGQGSLASLRMIEVHEEPTPDAPVVYAERLVDAMVADGTIELAGGDGPRARHDQVFALAERLAPCIGAWGPEMPARLGAWLLEQPEVGDLFGDDADLRELLLAAARSPEDA
jgi:hypothetical protein